MEYFLSRRYYYTIYIVLALTGFVLYFFYSKEELFFAVNGNHNGILDTIFFYATELGNTWTFILVICLSLFISRRFTWYLLVSLAISSLVAQGLKHFVFTEHLRPLAYFSDVTLVHHLKESSRIYYHSMPSGHSISAFGLATICVSFMTVRKYDLLFLLLACIAAYSRVYLGQHFVGDVLAGSILGVASATVAYFIVNRFARSMKFNTPYVRRSFGK